MAQAKIYQLKVTLKGIRPPIWRRLLIRSDTNLEQLHEVLLTTMGWLGGHLHQFVADDVRYGVPDDEWGVEVQDERRVTLADVAPTAGDRLVYEYDFGDGWEHDLLVEKMLDLSPVRRPGLPQGQASLSARGRRWHLGLRRVPADPE